MEPPVTVGGHGGGLSLQSAASRKEWRVVNEGSGRERTVGDGPGNQARIGTAGRPRPNSGAARRSSRNGQIFHPNGSDHSSDSDHHGGDLVGGGHLMGPSLASQELMSHGIGQGEEAALYEEAMGTESWLSPSKDHVFQMHRAQQRNDHLDSGLSSMSMDPGFTSLENPDEALRQRLHEVSRQRKQYQQAEVELRAQFIARSEVIRLQNGLDDQVKQQSEIVSTLQGQIQERDQQIHQLEQELEERERQLHANQRETNETVWAKDGLLREQTNELATLRRDRDNSVNEHQTTVAQFDAERTEHLAHVENLKDQLQEKDRLLVEAEEQSRNSQDIIIYKDDQLRDTQSWIARAQELDTYHVNTISTLHAELRDRTEQVNQLWAGSQRQVAEVERYYSQANHRLQQEINDAREQIRSLKGPSVGDHQDPKKENSTVSNNKETGHLESNDDGGIKGNRILMAVSPLPSRGKPNTSGNMDSVNSGNLEGLLPVLLPRDGIQPKLEPPPGLPMVQAPLLGITTMLPPSGPTAGIPQFGLHQQGVTPSLQPTPLQVGQHPLGPLQPIAAVLGPQHLAPLQHQQVLHHPHHHQSTQLQRVAQRPQGLILQQQTSQPLQSQQHVQQLSALQPPGQQNRHPDVPIQQQEEEALDQTATSTDQRNVLRSHVPSLPPQQVTHNQALQQQLTSQLRHHPQQSQVAGSEPNDMVSGAPQSRQEEHQSLASDIHQQKALNVQQQDLDLAIQRQQSKPQERQHFQHQQAKQPQHATQQLLQHEGIDSQTQQLQHQQGISSDMGHLGTTQTLSISQENSNSHVPRQAAVSVPPDSQELQSSVPQISKHHSYGDSANENVESALLDERSLLACLIRAVPAEPKIRISSTLPNRLGKMLAPLHWHNYKKQYGRLEDFVNSHPELFVIEGDFINLQEGAHATFSATTAVAKASAAAAAMAPVGPSRTPSVAVTPVAQPPVQRGRALKGSNFLQKEAKLGSTAATPDVGSQTQSAPLSGHSRQIQPPSVTRSTVENGNAHSHHAGISLNNSTKNGGKVDGQHQMQGGSSRANRVSPSQVNDTSANFENGKMNGYGTSGKNNGYYGNKQHGRGQVSGSGSYRKPENHLRPHTQEGRMSGSVSSS